MTEQDKADEAALVADNVDRAGEVHSPTELDEESVLRELYGDPDQYGVYRGVEA